MNWLNKHLQTLQHTLCYFSTKKKAIWNILSYEWFEIFCIVWLNILKTNFDVENKYAIYSYHIVKHPSKSNNSCGSNKSKSLETCLYDVLN